MFFRLYSGGKLDKQFTEPEHLKPQAEFVSLCSVGQKQRVMKIPRKPIDGKIRHFEFFIKKKIF